MSVLVYFCFDWPKEAMGDILFNEAKELALSIKDEPGFISKIWTENTDTNEAGGIYLFTDHNHAQNYIEKHTQRMTALGAKNIVCKIFDVNKKLTDITFDDS